MKKLILMTLLIIIVMYFNQPAQAELKYTISQEIFETYCERGRNRSNVSKIKRPRVGKYKHNHR